MTNLFGKLELPVVALGFILAGCSGVQEAERNNDLFSVADARHVFSVGFRNISDRFIKPVSLRKLSIVGLSGMSAIDPTIVVSEDGDNILVGYGSEGRITLSAPGTGAGPEKWAQFTVDAIRSVRKGSETARAASSEQIFEAVFDGSITLLDNFSRYSGTDKATRNREKRSGFGGIGISFRQVPEGALVTEVFDEAPAARAGIVNGDIITHANNQTLNGLSQHDISKFIKGDIGTTVGIRLERAQIINPFEFSIRRERVISPTVYASRKGEILHLQIRGFNKQTAHQLSKTIVAARRAGESPIGGIILDLRSNPGGLLSQAIKVADLFLTHGRIVSTMGRHPASRHSYNAHGTDLADQLPIVVLVNSRSASASEIVAAALQDHKRAVVVGSASYGKGTVQTVIPLPNDAELILTWSRFITPSGYVLHGLGVPPTICTSATPGSVSDLIGRAVNNEHQISRLMDKWRYTAQGNDRVRNELKSACPSSNLKSAMDGRIAAYLINHKSIYRRIAAMSPAVASAEK
ncbi:MAG: S41 family peptidase [Rhodospirillales bacterium]|nr:S41 family peptidase [Rhodospirillales bacterium]